LLRDKSTIKRNIDDTLGSSLAKQLLLYEKFNNENAISADAL
jgi:hypothetical protein